MVAQFDVISLSIICLGAIICIINTIAFVSVFACKVCDACGLVVQPLTRRP